MMRRRRLTLSLSLRAPFAGRTGERRDGIFSDRTSCDTQASFVIAAERIEENWGNYSTYLTELFRGLLCSLTLYRASKSANVDDVQYR